MIGNFQDIHTTDVKPIENDISNYSDKSSVPLINDLKTKLEHIVAVPQNIEENALNEACIAETERIKIILADGTIITIPEISDNKKTAATTECKNTNSEVFQNEMKPVRELTDDEKKNLQESLGWTDKQIAKCKIDEDGVIHYKTDREDMEGKTTDNGVPYERKTVDIHGIKVQGVFPVFESACDVQLPEELEKASNARQFKECNKQLKEKVAKDPALRETFTEEQLEEIEDGDTPTGYVWHHSEETGKMQLVKVEDHDRTQGGAAHTGGKALWGGGYSDHETSRTGESSDIQYNSTNKEME